MSFQTLNDEEPTQLAWNRKAKNTINAHSSALKAKAPTSGRPTINLYVGQQMFDETLGHPIWWNGSDWIDATGATV